MPCFLRFLLSLMSKVVTKAMVSRLFGIFPSIQIGRFSFGIGKWFKISSLLELTYLLDALLLIQIATNAVIYWRINIIYLRIVIKLLCFGAIILFCSLRPNMVLLPKRNGSLLISCSLEARMVFIVNDSSSSLSHFGLFQFLEMTMV